MELGHLFEPIPHHHIPETLIPDSAFYAAHSIITTPLMVTALALVLVWVLLMFLDSWTMAGAHSPSPHICTWITVKPRLDSRPLRYPSTVPSPSTTARVDQLPPRLRGPGALPSPPATGLCSVPLGFLPHYGCHIDASYGPCDDPPHGCVPAIASESPMCQWRECLRPMPTSCDARATATLRLPHAL